MSITHVTNTNAYPWRAAVSIYVRWSNGAITRGTGTMVGPNDVLTAAHVVYSPARGSPVSIRVIPGQNGSNTPFGIIDGARWNYYAIRYLPNGNLTQDQSAWDMAVIGLRQNAGSRTGWLGIRSNQTQTTTRNLIHYPSAYQVNFQNLRQMYSYNTVGYSGGTLNIGGLTISPGSSGGGIYILVGGNRYVTGTVSTASWGSFINTTAFNAIASWMASNNSVVNAVTQHFNFGTLGARQMNGSVNSRGNDIDRYAFNFLSAGRVNILLRRQTGDADIYLYNVYGQLLGRSIRAGTANDLIRRNLSAGIYYVEVNDYRPGVNRYNLLAGRTNLASASPTSVAGASRPSSVAAATRLRGGWLAA